MSGQARNSVVRLALLFAFSFCGHASAVLGSEEALTRCLTESGLSGGLVVHLGCGDGKATARLRVNDSMLVQALDQSKENVKKATDYFLERGLCGPLSAETIDGPHLPYADNLVNLVIAQDPGKIASSEILRVLVPRGVAFIKRGARWDKIVKPRPVDIDEWTHFLHDAGNNAVADDGGVGPPRGIQWLAPPLWLRSHETPSGMQAMVTGGGRIFYIFDEGLVGITDERLPDRWTIYARDAFNGTLLWKRPLKKWGWREWALERWKNKDWTQIRAGRTVVPVSNQRRLVVAGEKLFTTLSFDAPLSVLDSATGKLLRTIEGTDSTREILVHEDTVILKLEGDKPGLVAIDARQYKTVWRKNEVRVSPALLAAAGDHVYHVQGKQLLATQLQSGQPTWKVPIKATKPRTLVARKEAVLLLNARLLESFDAKTGKLLWREKVAPRQGAEVSDLFVIDGLVWTGMAHAPGKNMHRKHSADARAVGRDLLTGEIKKEILAPSLRSPEHHHRCYRNKATSRYIISSLEGAEFLDLVSDNHLQSNWARGACKLGMMPANGMLYVPSDQCFCSPGAKLLGFTALKGADRTAVQPVPDPRRLTRGKAYGSKPADTRFPGDSKEGWPTYRGDAARKGTTRTRVPARVSPTWEIKLGGKLTAPVAWRGKLYVARSDTNTLYALDIASGESLWTFTARGTIDSPPTIHKGFVLVGSRDGRVHCLRASDGEVVWSFLAAPVDRRICAFDRLESIWPVHGTVLVLDDIAYVAAGRSTYLDGGIHLYGLDIPTGSILHRGLLEGPHWKPPERDKSFFSPGANVDVLVAEGGFLYMRQKKLTKDLKEVEVPVLSSKGGQDVGLHVFSTSSFLDDSWYNRAFWMYSKRWPGFQLSGQAPKSGQLLVVDKNSTYAVKVFYRRNVHSPMFFPGTKGYLLYADKNSTEPQIYGDEGSTKPRPWLPQSGYDRGKVGKNGKRTVIPLDQSAFGSDKGIGYTRAEPPLWTRFLPIRINAMVKTENTLFVAGAPDALDDTDPYAAFEGRRGAVIAAISPDEGKELAQIDLKSPPVFDGLIAAYGKLFLSLRDGSVVCMR